MKRKVAEIILILLFYLIQVTFGNAIGIGGITPNLLIILPVLFGFFKGRNEGMLVGFLSGVMYDLFFSSLFGFSALVFVYIGYFSGIFYKEYEKVEVLIPLAMIMASDFVFEFLSYIGNFLLHNRLNVDFFLRRFIMPEVVYTLVVALVLYYPLMKLGVFFGLSAMHERPHLIRSVMEGISFSQWECVEVFREMGVPIEDMMICGGGGRSPFWRQMLADMYGCSVSTVQSDQGGALGAAILAGVGAGIYSDLETACDALVRKKDSSEPNMAANGAYAKYFTLYKELYRTLFQSFKDLKNI